MSQRFKRKKNRNKVKIKKDVERTGKLVREDVYEILSKHTYEDEALDDLRAFLEELPIGAIGYRGDKQSGIARVMSDVKSYDVTYEQRE